MDLILNEELLSHCIQIIVIIYYLGDTYKCNFSIVLIEYFVSLTTWYGPVFLVKTSIKESVDQWSCFVFGYWLYKPRVHEDW